MHSVGRTFNRQRNATRNIWHVLIHTTKALSARETFHPATLKHNEPLHRKRDAKFMARAQVVRIVVIKEATVSVTSTNTFNTMNKKNDQKPSRDSELLSEMDTDVQSDQLQHNTSRIEQGETLNG